VILRIYVAICKDYTDGRSHQPRIDWMQPHLRYLESIIDQVAVAGPLRGKHDGQLVGSLLVYKVTTEAQAKALLEGDPYFHAGIWETVEILPFSAAAGEWLGGVRW
jgi:uncharacterized protein